MFVSFSAGNASAKPTVPCICPTCNPFGQHCSYGCPFDYYTIHIYYQVTGGYAQLKVNGTDYQNGAVVPFCSTIKYTISADVSSAYSTFAFSYWHIVDGSVSSPSSPTTTFTPAPSNQEDEAIVMVLGPAANTPTNWGGYVASAGKITEAWGSFDIPTGPYSQEPSWECGIENTMGIWIGIGGLDGSGYLLQAGVQIQIAANSQCLGDLTMTEWYEAWPNPVQYVGGTPCDGPNYPFGVDLGVNSQGAWIDYGSCGVVKVSGLQFTPDQTTADWVVEAPVGYGPYPSFPNFNFFQCGYIDSGTAYSSFSAPIMSLTAIHQLALNGNYAQFNQTVTPSWVGSDYFTEQYSQSYGL